VRQIHCPDASVPRGWERNDPQLAFRYSC
jgi:hypothetical protein